MCGIAGTLSATPTPAGGERQVASLLESIRHRGPDDRGVFRSPGGQACLGMVRLSIIDLSTGHQPMFSDDGNHAFVFNGELYNFESLRVELEARGHVFRTRSDTEVALRTVLEFGIDGALPKLDGMFAFCLWDERQRVAYLARDFYGEKPLFYVHSGSHLAFCSELAPLIEEGFAERTLDAGAVMAYLAYQFNPGRQTLVRGAKKLAPASYLEVRPKGDRLSLREVAYGSVWDSALVPESSLGPLAAQREAKRLIESTVSSRMVSDVPIGVFLSGGLDSSIVAYEASLRHPGIETFSIAFEDPRFNESEFSRLASASLKTRHTEHVFTARDFVEELERLLPHQSEPFADAAAVPTSLLARAARTRVKVVLSGEGADEIFGGYDYYHSRFPLSPAESWRGTTFPSGFPAAFDASSLDRLARGFVNPELYSPQAPLPLSQGLSQRERFNLLLTHDLDAWLPGDLLVKTDTTTMMHSLECRAPFLNRDLHRFVFSLGLHLRAKNEVPKYLLKLLYGPLLPREIVFRRKQGFGLPLDAWLRDGALHAKAREAVASGPLMDEGFLDADVARDLLARHARGENWDRRLFSLMTLNLWASRLGLGAPA